MRKLLSKGSLGSVEIENTINEKIIEIKRELSTSGFEQAVAEFSVFAQISQSDKTIIKIYFDERYMLNKLPLHLAAKRKHE